MSSFGRRACLQGLYSGALMNCAILQTMSYSTRLFYGRTMYCTHYYHLYPPRHNATTSDTELTPDCCPNTRHTYPIVFFLHACYIRIHIRVFFFHNTRTFIHSFYTHTYWFNVLFSCRSACYCTHSICYNCVLSIVLIKIYLSILHINWMNVL